MWWREWAGKIQWCGKQSINTITVNSSFLVLTGCSSHQEVESISMTFKTILAFWPTLTNRMWQKWHCACFRPVIQRKSSFGEKFQVVRLTSGSTAQTCKRSFRKCPSPPQILTECSHMSHLNQNQAQQYCPIDSQILQEKINCCCPKLWVLLYTARDS